MEAYLRLAPNWNAFVMTKVMAQQSDSCVQKRVMPALVKLLPRMCAYAMRAVHAYACQYYLRVAGECVDRARATSCTTMRDFCTQVSQLGTQVRAACPKTCGLCPGKTSHAHVCMRRCCAVSCCTLHHAVFVLCCVVRCGAVPSRAEPNRFVLCGAVPCRSVHVYNREA